MEFMGVAGVAAIGVIAYLIGEAVNHWKQLPISAMKRVFAA